MKLFRRWWAELLGVGLFLWVWSSERLILRDRPVYLVSRCGSEVCRQRVFPDTEVRSYRWSGIVVVGENRFPLVLFPSQVSLTVWTQTFSQVYR